MRAQTSKKVDCFDQIGFSLAIRSVEQVDDGVELKVSSFVVPEVGEAKSFHIHSAVAISRKILFSRLRI